MSELDSIDVREVGGIHSLSLSDKESWARKHGRALRLVEVDTGREEIWFGRKLNYPRFVSLDNKGRLQSHRKFSHNWMPAIHFPSDNLIGSDALVNNQPGYQLHRSLLNIWCVKGEIGNLPGKEHALEAKGMIVKPKDPKAADYIEHIYIDDLKEFWKDGEFMHAEVDGVRICFFKKELNKLEVQHAMKEWLAKHCENGFFPFGNQLFGSEQEEFLFIAEFCT